MLMASSDGERLPLWGFLLATGAPMFALQQYHLVRFSAQPFGAVPPDSNTLLVAFVLLCSLIVVFSSTAATGHCSSPQHCAPRNKTRVTSNPDHSSSFGQPNLQQYVKQTHEHPPVWPVAACGQHASTLATLDQSGRGSFAIPGCLPVVCTWNVIGHGSLLCPGNRLGYDNSSPYEEAHPRRIRPCATRKKAYNSSTNDVPTCITAVTQSSTTAAAVSQQF